MNATANDAVATGPADIADTRSPRRDIIVIGGSAGGLHALGRVLEALPESLPAAVFAVLHVSGSETSRAAQLLQSACVLPVRFGTEEQPIEPGTVTIAQSDAHLLLGRRHIHLRRGPRENGFRPAIDPLFRSAVVHHPGHAIGVVLTGSLDDGASGARALARVGAPVLVQDPTTAEFPTMPATALRLVPTAESLSIDVLAQRLVRLAGSEGVSGIDPPEDVRLELMVSTLERATMDTENRLGSLTPFNCPDCNGVLWEIDDGPLKRYRCHTGHAYTAQVLSEVQEEAVERALYEALRAQRGRAHLLRKMATQAEGTRQQRQYQDKADGYDEDSATLEALLLRRET